MEVFRTFTLGTSGYLAVQALPLLLTPRAIVSLLASEPRRMTDLEAYLSRTLAVALLALAGLNLLLTGAIPLTSDVAKAQEEEETSDGPTLKNPYAYPTLVVTTLYHALTAGYIYANITSGGLGFALGSGVTASTGLFALGVWTMLFGSEKGRISKTTGADKRTGNFPFKNVESAKEKKKESKRKSVSSRSSRF